MDKMAFIGHPIDLTNLYGLAGVWGRLLKILPPYYLLKNLYYFPPIKYTEIIFYSKGGNKAKGLSFLVPLLPRQIISLNEEYVLKKILDSIKKAERLGSKIVILGGFTSVVGNEGEYLAKKVDIAITSGNTYTVSLAIDGIYEACKKMQYKIEETTGLILGATGDIGSACSHILSKKIKKLYIFARDRARLNALKQSLEFGTSLNKISIVDDLESILGEVDVVLAATSSVANILNPLLLKPGAIVCDVSIPANITREVFNVRNDVFVFEGGLASIPYAEKIKDKKFLTAMPGEGCVFGCLAEAMLLTLSKRFENFSIGRGNISDDKIQEIKKIADLHGFCISKFLCGPKVYNDDDIEKIYRNAEKSRKVV